MLERNIKGEPNYCNLKQLFLIKMRHTHILMIKANFIERMRIYVG